jgi:hypothetical protein
MIYCISYDLKCPGQNYEELYNAIKSYGTWWHQTGSVWLIYSQETSVFIRNRLMSYIDKNDKLFVVALKKDWAGLGFKENEYDWLRNLPDSVWQ